MESLKINFNIDFDFNLTVPLMALLNNEELIFTKYEKYFGPLTMQYLPNGGIQSLFNYLIIIKLNNGYLAVKSLIYKNKEYSSKEFILFYGANKLMNQILN